MKRKTTITKYVTKIQTLKREAMPKVQLIIDRKKTTNEQYPFNGDKHLL